MTIAITGYLDLALAEARDQHEAHGREYAREHGIAWPMPPDRYGPGRQPADRAAYYQRYEAGLAEDEVRARGLLAVTAAMELRTDRVVQVDATRTVRIADTRTKTATIPREWTGDDAAPTRDPLADPAPAPTRTR